MAIVKSKRLYLDRIEASAMLGVSTRTFAQYTNPTAFYPVVEEAFTENRKAYYLIDDIFAFWFAHYTKPPACLREIWDTTMGRVKEEAKREFVEEVQKNPIEEGELPPARVEYLRSLADLELRRERVKAERIKREQLEGKLVTPEDADGAMAEQMAIFLTFYRQDKQQLPSMLEHRSANDIRKMLDSHYAKRINLTREIFKRAMRRISALVAKRLTKDSEEAHTILDKLYEWLNVKTAEKSGDNAADAHHQSTQMTPEPAIKESVHKIDKTIKGQTRRRKLGKSPENNAK